jgi:YjbE family integral membrane protein
MVIPYLKIAGGMALLWIATRLLVNENNGSEAVTSPSRDLLDAVKAIAVADVVMSLDNVIAVVAAADGNFALIVFGLGMSIPVIVAGATIIMAVLNYVPAIAWVGAALLGWIAGDVIATDAAVVQYASALGSAVHEHTRLTCSVAMQVRMQA